MSSNNARDLPKRLQDDEAFGGYIGVEDVYNGETAKKLDLTRFDDIIKKSMDVEQKDIVSFMGAKKRSAGSFKSKTSLPKPKHSAPTKNIKTSPGKGTSQLSKSVLQSRLDNIIKQVEQKGIKGGVAGTIAGGLLGGLPGAIIGGGVGDVGENALPKKMRKGLAGAAAGGALGSPLGPAGAIGGAGLGSIAEDYARKKWNEPKVDVAQESDKTKLGFHRDLKTGRYVRDAKSLLKAQAYLSVERAIYLIKGYIPMDDNAIRKAFGDQVPDQMQDSSSRPPEDWWNKCMQETGDEQQCLVMWNKEASQSQAPWQEEKPDTNPNVPGIQPGEEPDGGQPKQPGEVDYDGLGKWMGGALQGGTLSSLLGHPIAGAAIQAAGKAIGQKIMGKEVSEEEAQQIGMAAFDAIEGIINESDDDSMKKAWPALASRMIPTLARGAGKKIPMQIPGVRGSEVDQKSVVQQLDKKTIDAAMPARKPNTDFGGESEVSGDGSKADLRGLLERSEVQDETGASKKIDAKKIAHEYKIK